MRETVNQLDSIEAIYQNGNVLIEASTSQLLANKSQLSLSGREKDLFLLLIRNNGKHMKTKDIMEALYGPKKPDASIIKVLVCHIRKKLRAIGVQNLILSKRPGYVVPESEISSPAQIVESDEETESDEQTKFTLPKQFPEPGTLESAKLMELVYSQELSIEQIMRTYPGVTGSLIGESQRHWQQQKAA